MFWFRYLFGISAGEMARMPLWERHVLAERAGHFLPALIPNPEGVPKESEGPRDAALLEGGDYAVVRAGGDA